MQIVNIQTVYVDLTQACPIITFYLQVVVHLYLLDTIPINDTTYQ